MVTMDSTGLMAIHIFKTPYITVSMQAKCLRVTVLIYLMLKTGNIKKILF